MSGIIRNVLIFLAIVLSGNTVFGVTPTTVPQSSSASGFGTVDYIEHRKKTIVVNDASYKVDDDVVVYGKKSKVVKFRKIKKGDVIMFLLSWSEQGKSAKIIKIWINPELVPGMPE